MKTVKVHIGVSWVLITAVLVALKLCHVIAWSWWIVLAPLLLTSGVGIFCLIAAAVCYAVAAEIMRSLKK